jgi:membrane-bound lytic murein transglycosylase B
MLNCRQVLQIGLLTILVDGCAASHRGQATLSETAPQAVSASQTTPDRLGLPSAEANAIASTVSDALDLFGPIRPEVYLYAQQLATERQLPLKKVLAILSRARYNNTVARLILTPAGQKTRRSWRSYQDRVVEPKHIARGVVFWEENHRVLERATQQYGVPASIIVSILGVETFYGRHMGSFKVVDTLTTLAFAHPEPAKPERVAMFRQQLSDFITLCLRGHIAPEVLGSYAGAIGMPQFMPSSIMHYAVDEDNNGHVDLVNNVQDAVMSIANFLKQHGWQQGVPVFAPVILPPDPSNLLQGGRKPTTDWPGLQKAGASLLFTATSEGWQQKPLGVIDLPEEPHGTTQYRVATENFFALTDYNRSYFYAAAVADLAMALEKQRRRDRSHRRANRPTLQRALASDHPLQSVPMAVEPIRASHVPQQEPNAEQAEPLSH